MIIDCDDDKENMPNESDYEDLPSMYKDEDDEDDDDDEEDDDSLFTSKRSSGAHTHTHTHTVECQSFQGDICHHLFPNPTSTTC